MATTMAMITPTIAPTLASQQQPQLLEFSQQHSPSQVPPSHQSSDFSPKAPQLPVQSWSLPVQSQLVQSLARVPTARRAMKTRNCMICLFVFFLVLALDPM